MSRRDVTQRNKHEAAPLADPVAAEVPETAVAYPGPMFIPTASMAAAPSAASDYCPRCKGPRAVPKPGNKYRCAQCKDVN